MVARLRSPFPRLGRGRRFLLPPRTAELRDRALGPSPQPGRTKDSGSHLPNPVPGPSPPRSNRAPRGTLSGNGGVGGGGRRKKSAGLAARQGPWGSVGPGGQGPLERLRTWERPGPGRPLGAGGDLALGPWRRGRPGLAQRRRLQEARGFGLRRRLVPRPLSSPRSVRETAALRPAPSAAQAPAPAPTSTWGPIETVRHAPPPPPPGAAAAALGRGRGGEAPRAGSRRRAHSGLMEEEGCGPLRGSLAPRAERTAAGAPAEPAAPEHPPPAAALRFSLLPQTRLPRLRRGGGEGGSQRPPAARRPRARPPRLLRFVAGWVPRPSRPLGQWLPGRRTALPDAGTGRGHLGPPPGAGREQRGVLTPGRPYLRGASR